MSFVIRCLLAFVVAAIWFATTPSLAQQDSEKKSETTEQEKKKSKIPEGVDFYKGRRVAQTMHYSGAEWLIRDNRERQERASLLLTNLGLKKGMTVCDMGCGNGFHSLPIAKLIGEKGTVYGVDIQPEMLKFLRARCEKEGVENITPVLGSIHNPRLPKNTFDLILLVDVYHEFSHPEQMLAAMRAALKPKGVIALVEFRLEDKDVPIKLLHKMSKKQIMKEFPPNGLKLVKEFDKLPWQHLMFFQRDEDWKPEKKKTESAKSSEGKDK